MAVVTIAALKAYFETGDFPTQSQFEDLIDTLGVGSTFESKTFVLNAAGTSITGSTAGITLETSGAAAKIRIPTTKTLKLWQGFIYQTGTPEIHAQGRSDGTMQSCTNEAYVTYASATNCISVGDIGGDGWLGLITTITSTYFEITFTRSGSGIAITGQMNLIE